MQELKYQVCNAIDRRREEIIAIGEDILRHPELGYREERTSALVKDWFARLELTEPSFPAVTGVKGWMRGLAGKQKVSIAVMGELDAVVSPQHPFADKETGAAHACGHNAQIAAMLGCAMGLSAVRKYLQGDICFLAVPAEEYCEIQYRKSLVDQGKLRYLGGKQQMIAEGAFDDIDIAMMVHRETNAPQPHVVTDVWSTGFIGKTVRFLGKEAHAGGAPWEGINALNAASLAIQAVNCCRETFRDEDHIRVHPIITKGGDLVNTVPAEVCMESYVRGASLPAMQSANAAVNRAIRGAAYALGAKAEVKDLPGYLPLQQNETLGKMFAANAAELLPDALVEKGLPFCGSTDGGDLSWVLPLIQPTVSGFSGAAHSKDFRITDPELAYLVPAKLMAMTVIDLLENGAAKAWEIKRSCVHHTADEYQNVWSELLKQNEVNMDAD